MFVIANCTNNETSKMTTMSVNTNLISPAMRLFLKDKNIKIEVLQPQLPFLK